MKTNDLKGAALDWAVAKCEGENLEYWMEKFTSKEDRRCFITAYSTSWNAGGPIIERENIALRRWLECGWQADIWNFKFVVGHSQGTTPLEAAMRCYVASKLGDEVEVPEDLT